MRALNKAQKEAAQAQLKAEQKTLRELKQVYNQARKDCQAKIAALNARKGMEPENLQTIIYQEQYQRAIMRQIDSSLQNLNTQQYETIDSFLQDSYRNGYTGVMYDLDRHGIPLAIPIDQEQVARAVRIGSKISQGMYTRLGEDVAKLKNSIRAEVSRGILNGSTWIDVAGHIANGMNNPFDKAINNAVRIARTEGHRIQQSAALDAQKAAKKAGADVVKQWDSTLDGVTRPAHQEADGQIRDVEEPFFVDGEYIMAPGDGSASNCINCRCVLLQRAKWALSEAELDVLKARAEFYGLDKTDQFEEFKEKYLQIPETETEATADVLERPVEGTSEQYRELLKGISANNIDYRPVERHDNPLSQEEIINALSGGDRTRGSCASVGLAYMGQSIGLDVLDFRDGTSRWFFSSSGNLLKLSKMPGMSAIHYGDVKGSSSCTLANNFLKTCEVGKEYYLCVGRHAAIVRRNEDGKLQYLELQSATNSGWTNFNGNPRYTLTHRFGCYSSSGHGEKLDFMLNITDSNLNNDEFRSLLGFLNTAESAQVKGHGGTIK